jgi:hypothetical protein
MCQTISPDGLVDQFNPTTLDIRINKVCNLKCRSCSPHLSSAIAQEVQGIYNVDWPALTNRQRKSVMSEIYYRCCPIPNTYILQVVSRYWHPNTLR